MNKIFFKRILMILLCLLMVSVGLTAGDPLKTFASDEDTTRVPNELSGIAYAVFDSSDGSLKLFRDEEGAYNDNQVEGTKTYYADIEVRNMALYAPWFEKRNEIRSFSIKEGDTIRPDTCNSWFIGCTDLTDCDLKGLDTSEASSLESMFEGCSSLNALDLSGFDTSNVANMNCMFQNCSSLISLDLSMFDTSKLTSMGQMFNGCSSLVELDISSFDISRVTVYNAIFTNSAVTLIKLGPDFRFISGFFAVPLQRVKLSDDVTKVSEPIVYSKEDYTGEAPGWYRVGGQTIGVFDSNDGSLRFVEDTECEHLLGGTEGSRTYYTNILNTENSNPPWYDKRTEIKSVSFEA
ncbi:MAG: BspA family leucine-rich repeat surface protein, partial [Firmicutes bacterium]|nr:BspA family leucine-rich repeat surface protein [Bacillota bacterium]